MLESLIKSFAEERGLAANYPREDIIRMMLEAGEIVESDVPGNYRIPSYEEYLNEFHPMALDQEPEEEDEDEDGELPDNFFDTVELESPATGTVEDSGAEFDEDEEDLY